MKFVMDKLKDAVVSLDDWDSHKRKVVAGSGKVRKLDAYDLALLLTLAYSQHDEEIDGVWKDSECFCYGNPEYLAQLSHMGQTKFEECRAFAIAAGLISYDKTKSCLNLNNPQVRTRYTNVYRLNKGKMHILSGETAKQPENLATQGKNLATQGEKPCHASTNITYNKKKNSSIHDTAVAEVIIEYIATVYGLTDEQRRLIGKQGILVAIRGKDLDSVKKKINEFGCREMLEKKFSTWVGMLIGELKTADATEEATANLSDDELKAMFTVAKVENHADYSDEAVLQRAWDEIFKSQRLADFDEAAQNELKTAYDDALGMRQGDILRLYLKRLKDLLPSSTQDSPERYEAIKSVLMSMKNNKKGE